MHGKPATAFPKTHTSRRFHPTRFLSQCPVPRERVGRQPGSASGILEILSDSDVPISSIGRCPLADLTSFPHPCLPPAEICHCVAAFIVASKDILDTEIHEQGGRKITIQEINPIDLPRPPLAERPADKTDPAVQARIAAFRAKYPRNELTASEPPSIN